MTQAEMVAALRTDGWRGFSQQPNDEYVLRGYKFFETPTLCALNKDKPGIQVECTVWEFPDKCPARPVIELHAEAADGHWPRLSIDCDDLDDVKRQIPRLLATWEFIANWEAAWPAEPSAPWPVHALDS